MSTIAIIPARGGSKGIPLKNLAHVGGKPLLDWTIEAAQQSEEIDSIYVTTDNELIAVHALGFMGVQVVKRPDNISDDNAQIEDAMLHVLNQIPIDGGNDMLSEVVLLQPTSPIRRPHDIDAAIDEFRRRKFESLFSATPIFPYVWLPVQPSVDMEMDIEPMERAFHKHEQPRLNRQDRRPLLQESGSIYVTRALGLVLTGNRLNGRVGYYRMPPWTAIEIDNYYDVTVANAAIAFYREELI